MGSLWAYPRVYESFLTYNAVLMIWCWVKRKCYSIDVLHLRKGFQFNNKEYELYILTYLVEKFISFRRYEVRYEISSD